MKIYLCVISWPFGTNDQMSVTDNLKNALQWQKDTQDFENAAAASGFRNSQRYVLRSEEANQEGYAPNEGPTISIETPATGAGTARVFEIEAKEIRP